GEPRCPPAAHRVAICKGAVMPQSIPPGLTKEHVIKALNDLDGGIDHPFGAPTGYELASRSPPDSNSKRTTDDSGTRMVCGITNFSACTAQAVSLDRRQGEQVLRAVESGLQGRGRELAGPDVVDDPLPGAGADQLGLLGGGVSRTAHGAA